MPLFLNLLLKTDSYSNEYLLAKIGVDTAENEPLKKFGGKFNSIFIRVLKDHAYPTMLTFHSALKTDDEEPCTTEEMANCVFYALFSECVNVTGALITPIHETLDLTFGASDPMFFLNFILTFG